MFAVQVKLYELSILSLLEFLKTLRDFIRFSPKGRLFQFLGNVYVGSVFMNDSIVPSSIWLNQKYVMIRRFNSIQFCLGDLFVENEDASC